MQRSHSWPEGHWAWPIKLTHKHGLRCGDMIFIGGQVDLDSDGRVRHPGDLARQTQEAMAYMARVLAGLDADLGDLVKLVAYYAGEGPEAEAALLREIARALPPGSGPTISLVPLPALAYGGMVSEIEAVAMRGEDGARLPRRTVSPEGLPPLPAPFSHALACGDMIFVGDQAAIDETGAVIAPGDVVAQSQAMMERLGDVLGRLGADFEDVVKLNVFYIGAGDAETWAIPAKIRAGFFPEPGPAATGVPLPGFGQPGLMTRIAVTAMRDPDGDRLAKSFSWPEGHWDWTTHLPYKHANRCGRMIHVGGQVSLNGRGGVIDPDDMPAQTRRSMDYIASALVELGAGLDDVVKVTAFYQGGASAEALHENLAIRSGSFTEPGPASTGVPIPYLAYEDMLIEIEVTAMVD